MGKKSIIYLVLLVLLSSFVLVDFDMNGEDEVEDVKEREKQQSARNETLQEQVDKMEQQLAMLIKYKDSTKLEEVAKKKGMI
tara:strand:- start:279 stop:524 length:246 start_codon:yes stop_codon:yes gene_type:complete